MKDSEGVTVSFTMFENAVVDKGDTSYITQSWTPTMRGIYKVEVFAWESVSNPVPLAPTKSMQIVVQ